MRGIEAVIFGCPNCDTRLMTELTGSYFGENICPQCHEHVRVQQVEKRRGGIALFIDLLKHKPRHRIMYKQYHTEGE